MSAFLIETYEYTMLVEFKGNKWVYRDTKGTNTREEEQVDDDVVVEVVLFLSW